MLFDETVGLMQAGVDHINPVARCSAPMVIPHLAWQTRQSVGFQQGIKVHHLDSRICTC